nr:MAG TPA: Stage V sporulation protein T, Activator, DNA-binding, Repressor, Sporulation [Caudoviricetes sp.]
MIIKVGTNYRITLRQDLRDMLGGVEVDDNLEAEMTSQGLLIKPKKSIEDVTFDRINKQIKANKDVNPLVESIMGNIIDRVRILIKEELNQITPVETIQSEQTSIKPDLVEPDDILKETTTPNKVIPTGAKSELVQACEEKEPLSLIPELTTTKKTIVESNLYEDDKFKITDKYYSQCKQVVKAKRLAVARVCNYCQGKLLPKGSTNCPFKQHKFPTYDNVLNSVKSAKYYQKHKMNQPQTNSDVTEIKKSFQIIKDGFTIADPESELSYIQKPIKPINTTEKKELRVKLDNEPETCSKCLYTYPSGFYINDKFVCKSCTLKDFSQYKNNNLKWLD